MIEKKITDSLPSEDILRPATARDIWSIRRLVLSAFLEPTQLRWQQFWVIERENQIIACGQLRNYEGFQELGSLVVVPAWRNQGIGTYLSKHLIQAATKPLYLKCVGEKRVEFYSRLGFVPISREELPLSLKQKFRMAIVVSKILRVSLKIMRYQ